MKKVYAAFEKAWKTTGWLLLLVVLPVVALAQVDSTEDLHRYFDDGGLSQRKNIIATNLLSPISGVASLRFERALTKHVSLEVGVYRMLPFYLWELLLPVNVYFDDFVPKGGWGISAAPHFYFWGDAPEFHYFGPRFGWRYHTMPNGAKLDVKDFTIDYGYNLFFTNHFMFCYDIGWGYRRMTYSYPVGGGSILPESRGTLYMFWSIGLGVMF